MISEVLSNSEIMQFYPKDYITSGKVNSTKSNNVRLSQLQKDWKPWCLSLVTLHYKYNVLWGQGDSGEGINDLLTHDSGTQEYSEVFLWWGVGQAFFIHCSCSFITKSKRRVLKESELGLES